MDWPEGRSMVELRRWSLEELSYVISLSSHFSLGCPHVAGNSGSLAPGSAGTLRSPARDTAMLLVITPSAKARSCAQAIQWSLPKKPTWR